MALTTVKIVVFAPIPNASDKTATTLKLGLFSNTRAPWRRSCQKSFTFHLLEVSGVPGNVGQLFLARLPLGAGKKARRDLNQAGNKLEDTGRVPGLPVARAVLPSVERVGHTSERHVLGDRRFGLAGEFDFALPLERHQTPARVMHLGEVNRSRRDGDLLSNAIDSFHIPPPGISADYTQP